MYKHILDTALELAFTKAISDAAHRHSCVIFDKKGRIYSVGYNVEQENSRAARYHRYFCFHAESLAIDRMPRTNISLYLISIRINKQGLLRNARPCSECMALIKKQNIRAVYYSDAQGQIIKEQL